jgi:uncharacterized protein YndB with AHSA1/START domain
MIKPDPKLDLVLERHIEVPRALLWKAWTQPEHLKKWFCPKPWHVSECRIDLRPGGEFFTVFNGPDGERMENAGCYLEVVPEERLTWTDALLAGFRPSGKSILPGLVLTVVLTLKSEGTGTRYTAVALHKDETGRRQHAEMGFNDGWNKATDQLVELAKTL